MTVSTSAPAKKPKTILVFRNGQWGQMPHRNHFQNMLSEHIRKIVGYRNKQREELSIRTHLAQGEVVHVNHATFRFKHDVARPAPNAGVSQTPAEPDAEATSQYVAQ